MEQKIIKFQNKVGKICGYWIDSVYRKQVDSKKHKLRIFDAYGIDEDIINQLDRGNNTGSLKTEEIRIFEKDTRKKLRIDFDVFIEKLVTKDLGEGPQCFVSLKYFIEY